MADAVANCETVILPDDDGDGASPPADCNDGDSSIAPGAVDRPGDGIDQDCNGTNASTLGLLDRDGDHTSPPQDCDDGNPAIHPGAPDRPAYGIDEDCSGADSAFPHVTSPIDNAWLAGKRVTRIVRSDVLSVPAGGRVEVRSPGRGCAFHTRPCNRAEGARACARCSAAAVCGPARPSRSGCSHPTRSARCCDTPCAGADSDDRPRCASTQARRPRADYS